MKKFLPLILVCSLITALIPTELSAQNYRFEAGFNVGGSNYLGDIGGKYLERRGFISDLKLKQTSLTGGIMAKYALTPRISLRFDAQYARIRGNDSLTTNPGRNQRNLSFRNDIKEASLSLEYDLYEAYNVGGNSRYRVDYTLYGILGVGYYMHDPMALYNGKYVRLQPLKTEGVAYSLSGISTVMGFGMDFTMGRNYKVGLRFTLHTTSTDYLDDISGNYKPLASFDLNTPEGQLAYALSDRRAEKDPDFEANPLGGEVRGNSKYDDSYMFATVNFAYVFKGKGGKYKRQFHNGYIRKKGRRVGGGRFFAF